MRILKQTSTAAWLLCVVSYVVGIEFFDDTATQGLPRNIYCPGAVVTGPQNNAFCNAFAPLSDSGNEYSQQNDDIFEDLPDDTQPNYRCIADLLRILDNLNETWAQSMLDAAGKPQSGIMEGVVAWPGNFFECRNTSAPPVDETNKGFDGQYCTLNAGIGNINHSIPITVGICVPDTCTEEMLTNYTSFITKYYLPLNTSDFSVGAVKCKVKSLPWDAPAIVMLCIISLFAALAFTGTSLTIYERLKTGKSDDTLEPALPVVSANYHEIIENGNNADKSILLNEEHHENDSFVKKFFKCFCVITNGAKILDTSNKGEFRCIHGIRFLSMSWVILGHTFIFVTNTGIGAGFREVMYRLDNLAFEVIPHGVLSVDSFFLLSGFLLTYLFLKEATKKEGTISWGLYYFHRYWRLTPVYAVVLGFDYGLTRYVANGPFWPSEGNEAACKDHWWWNFLYINNLPHQNGLCMGWSWFLANDMQFYVISPIFLYCLWRWPKIGLSIIVSVLVGSWIAAFMISWHYDFFAGLAGVTNADNMQNFMGRMTDYFQMFYIKPYTRIGPFLVGVILGYILFREREKRTIISVMYQAIGWLLAAAVSLGIIYGLHDTVLSKGVASAYNALSSSLFTACLGWVIFACITERGGFVNKILSHELFIPLSRLTYCAYLVHPIIIIGYYQSMEITPHINSLVVTTLFLGFLVMSYATALVTSLLFEAPFMAIEKLFIKRT